MLTCECLQIALSSPNQAATDPRQIATDMLVTCRGTGTNEGEGQIAQGVCGGAAQTARGGGATFRGTVGQGATLEARRAGFTCRGVAYIHSSAILSPSYTHAQMNMHTAHNSQTCMFVMRGSL